MINNSISVKAGRDSDCIAAMLSRRGRMSNAREGRRGRSQAERSRSYGSWRRVSLLILASSAATISESSTLASA
jgi:hypothetical protein